MIALRKRKLAIVHRALGRALALHNEALGHLHAGMAASMREEEAEFGVTASTQWEIAARMDALCATLAPGWLGLPWNQVGAPEGRTLGGGPVFVRVGQARPLSQARFGLVVPLLGAGHLVLDHDVFDPRVSDLMRGTVLRVLAATRYGSVRVRVIDVTGAGQTFAGLTKLVEAGGMPAAATTAADAAALIEEAHRHQHEGNAARAAGRDVAARAYLLLVVTGLGWAGTRELDRLASLAHAGPAGRLHMMVAGYHEDLPDLPNATHVELADHAVVSDPPGERFGITEACLDSQVELDPGPPIELVEWVAGVLAEQARRDSAQTVSGLFPATLWQESSARALTAVAGRDPATSRPVTVSFDDATPHWLLAGRPGMGKTVFLLNVMYGLTARYSPAELALYLLDFKEGVSFAEFTPTETDPTWIPHVRAVGVESDREYGRAVLAELCAEMTRRADLMKRAGVTKLADLRERHSQPVPRVVAVIDEFQVLFQRNDSVAKEAAELLEQLARKGRSYGVHLMLASQTIKGIDGLLGKTASIFGQFAMRIAMPGGESALSADNPAANRLELGQMIVNPSGGMNGGDQLVTFPNAAAESATTLASLRHTVHQRWLAHGRNTPPLVFDGGAVRTIAADPRYLGLCPRDIPQAMVGELVEVGMRPAAFPMEPRPGRHLAVLGADEVGASVLHATAVSLARQHEPGTARFVLTAAAHADRAARNAADTIAAAGHECNLIDTGRLRGVLADLADAGEPRRTTYLLLFGADAAAGELETRDERRRTGLDDLRAVLRHGPARKVHVLGWWSTARRFIDDIGGSQAREDVACLVLLNVAGTELIGLLGPTIADWEPERNRALLIDRQAGRKQLLVPFSGFGTSRAKEEIW